MRTFAYKPRATQPTTSAKSTTPGLAPVGQARDRNPILNLQRTLGNQAVQRLLEENRGKGKDDSTALQAQPAAGAIGRSATAAGATSTRNVSGDVSQDEVVTTNGTPAPAPGATPASPPPPAAPSTADGQCYVNSGPTYTPSGAIPVTTSGGRKRATFSMAATFGTALVTVPPRRPRCCEVRQYIKWDSAFHTWRGGPPHSGFPSSATANTWYEDRDTSDKRYGHRSGPHSDPAPGFDEYLTGGTQDQANGDTYRGSDAPGGPASMVGQFQFQLKVIDTCNGDAVKASSGIITINWGSPPPAPAPGVTPPSPAPPATP